MEGNMWIFATLGLLLCWMMPVDSMAVKVITLDMVVASVDDMYLGCNGTNMTTTLKKKYPEEEESLVGWSGTKCIARDNFDLRKDKALTMDHINAICVYTGNAVFNAFNTAVRTEGDLNQTSFEYHILHYLLTSAIQTLNSNYQCQLTFRRTKDIYRGTVNEKIRFGSFTSTSLVSTLVHFGKITCFKIMTCLGAPLSDYSIYGYEKEVLIPPYETFIITDIINDEPDKKKPLEDCTKVFVLKSLGAKSNLNCMLYEPDA